MMKAKDTNNAFSLSLLALAYFFLLQILINSNKASASGSWLSTSLPNSDKNKQPRCGFPSCYEKCPPGSCCSWLGECGTTINHCGRQYCQSQCPPPPLPPPPPPPAAGRCGMQAEGRKCPTGLCCSSSGWCGTTQYYCDPQYCQRQCRLPPEAPPPPPDAQQCGVQGGGKKCPTGMCCSEQGWCGTTQYYCNPKWCQSQCQIPYLSSNNRTTDEQRCGYQGCYKECPSGSCCNRIGYCGTTFKYCSAYWCVSQCPSPPPPPPYAPGRCGMQAGGRKCPTGLCCSSSGWCGTTEYYCAKQWCQSQCNTIISSTKNSTETFLLDGVV